MTEPAADRVVTETAEERLEHAFLRVIRSVQRKTIDRLHAAAHVQPTGERAVVADAGDVPPAPPAVVADPAALFSAAEWEALVQTAVAPVVEDVVVDAAHRVAVGVAFDVASPAMAEAVLRHVQAIESWGPDLRFDVANVVEAGMREGWSVARIAEQLRTDTLSEARAVSIGRTEAVAAANAGTLEGFRAVSGPGAQKQWLATDDGRTRPTHSAADGQTVPIGAPFEVGGALCEYPGDPRLPVAERVNCRCTFLTVHDDAAAAATQPADTPSASSFATAGMMEGSVPGRNTVPETLDVQNAATFQANSTGGMIALIPEAPEALAVEGGDPPEELHLTLRYVAEDAAALDEGAVAAIHEAAVAAAASRVEPITANVIGAGTLGDNDPQAVVLFVEGDGISVLHHTVEAVLADYGLESFPPAHDTFLPHVTLGYGIDVALAQQFVGGTITFAPEVVVVLGGEKTVHPFGAEVAADEPADEDDTGGEAEPDDDGDGQMTQDVVDAIFAQLIERLGDGIGWATDDRVSDDDLDQAEGEVAWVGVLVVEDAPSGDRRFIEAGALTWRDLPLPLMAMTRNPEGGDGHAGGELVGRIDEVWRDGNRIMGRGVFDLGGAAGREAYRLVRDGMLRGVSVDMDDTEARHENQLPPDAGLEEALNFDPGMVIFTKGRIMGATLCPFPAFQEAYVTLVDEDETAADTIVAAAGPALAGAVARSWLPIGDPAVVASAGAPERPPAAWFTKPDLDAPTPVRVTADGRVFGHVAQWGSCHIGMPRCVTPDQLRSAAGYRYFRTGQTLCDDGALVATGPIVVDTVHPNLRLAASDAQAFYADTGCAIADVVVFEDRHGIGIAGAIRPEATEAQVRKLRGGDVSPDWRMINGRLEIVAMLTVNNSGYKVAAVAASAGPVLTVIPDVRAYTRDGNVVSLVASSGLRPTLGSEEAFAAELAELRAELEVISRAIRPQRVEQAKALAERLAGRRTPATV